MLITVEDYKKITGATLEDNEKARVETLLGIAISQIEIVSINSDDEYKSRGNYIEFVNFSNCPCNIKEKEIEVTYKAGYDELPDWLKYEISMLVNDFINGMDEESGKYKSYKIDDISYTFVDFVANKREKIESVVRWIYG